VGHPDAEAVATAVNVEVGSTAHQTHHRCHGDPDRIRSGLTRMNESFDIFRREFDGSFVWVGATETFALAREKIVQDPASSDREFLIVNALTGERTVVEPPERPPVESPV